MLFLETIFVLMWQPSVMIAIHICHSMILILAEVILADYTIYGKITYFKVLQKCLSVFLCPCF